MSHTSTRRSATGRTRLGAREREISVALVHLKLAVLPMKIEVDQLPLNCAGPVGVLLHEHPLAPAEDLEAEDDT